MCDILLDQWNKSSLAISYFSVFEDKLGTNNLFIYKESGSNNRNFDAATFLSCEIKV